MHITRRGFLLGTIGGGVALSMSTAAGSKRTTRPIEIIAAPSNLGLRPPSPGHEPGAWRAPAALFAAGLTARLEPARVVELSRPRYDFEPQPATRIRNGLTLREHGLTLADAVRGALTESRFALVVGGDCSILLGCLLGARRHGRCGLVHVDGHSDFYHPGNYDAAARLGSAAGMELALATGRGELLLTHWPEVGRPLVADEEVIQIGDREPETAASAGSVEGALAASIEQLTIRQVRKLGVAEAARRGIEHLRRRGVKRAWLHVDLDVLADDVMPAVDSPGHPGLDFAQLAELIAKLVASELVIGMNVTIYDPELDPGGVYARRIVECLAAGLHPLSSGDRR